MTDCGDAHAGGGKDSDEAVGGGGDDGEVATDAEHHEGDDGDVCDVLLVPGRVGRRGRGGGLETAVMRTPAAARTTAKPWVGGVMTDCGDAHASGGENNSEAGEIRRGLGGGLTRGANEPWGDSGALSR